MSVSLKVKFLVHHFPGVEKLVHVRDCTWPGGGGRWPISGLLVMRLCAGMRADDRQPVDN